MRYNMIYGLFTPSSIAKTWENVTTDHADVKEVSADRGSKSITVVWLVSRSQPLTFTRGWLRESKYDVVFMTGLPTRYDVPSPLLFSSSQNSTSHPVTS